MPYNKISFLQERSNVVDNFKIYSIFRNVRTFRSNLKNVLNLSKISLH